MNDTKSLIEAMTSSKIYQDYERAFTQATGMVVALRPAESWQLPHHGQRSENGFCGKVTPTSCGPAVTRIRNFKFASTFTSASFRSIGLEVWLRKFRNLGWVRQWILAELTPP